MRILSIETSCDETSLSLVEAKDKPITKKQSSKTPAFRVIKNLVSSQIEIHRPFGGVVPNLAKREHIKNLPVLFKKLFGFDCQLPNRRNRLPVDIITVTVGPGLEPALWSGIEFAKELAQKYKKPLIGANHMEGHLYSFLLPSAKKAVISNFKFLISDVFPSIALIVSGGHTILLKMDSLTKWKKLGETRDDAVGESFDKVARMLNLPYPGGPEIEKLAKTGDPNAIPFPRPMIRTKDYDFSFSGLKTSVLYYIRNLSPITYHLTPNAKANIAASFQQAAFDVLIHKTMRAAREFGANSVILTGGVAASRTLRQMLGEACEQNKVKLLTPDFEFNTDNAAMIAAAAYMGLMRKKKYPLKANSNLNL